MLLIKTGQTNTMVVTVSQNSTISNPQWLFSFTHIFSKDNVTFIPTDISTHKNRYDEFEFVEGSGGGQVNFPFIGLYLYGIYQNSPAQYGNLNPSLSSGIIESGQALILYPTGNTIDNSYTSFISNNEDNSNFIFISDYE